MIRTIKTTLVGGVIFLVPVGIVLLVLQEVVDLALVVASPLADLFPRDDVFGIAMASVIAWVLVLLICYLFGLLATTRANAYSKKMDEKLAQIVPGYRLLKTRISALLNVDDDTNVLKVVEVHQFDAMRWAMEVERSEDGQTALVYYPGAPNPNNGSLQVVPVEQLRPSQLSPERIFKGYQFYGKDLLRSARQASDQ